MALQALVQGVTVNDGDMNVALRDVNIHAYYHGGNGGEIDIVSALRSIRNIRKVHLDVLSKATAGTGVWFLRWGGFLLWLDPNGDLRILWGTGIPGAGKSVLAAIAINELETRAGAANGRICVAYVYIRYSESADLTVGSILEILVKQTVERHADCAALAKEAYSRHLYEDTKPTEAELLQLLHRFTQLKVITFYFLDALDEAPEPVQLDLVEKLATLNVRLFITSRPLKDIQAQLPDTCSFNITTQDADLDLHIAQEIRRSSHLRRLIASEGQSFRDAIVLSVKDKCGGMFLHASLQLVALSRCVSLFEVNQTLQAFPPSIEDVYLQAWERIHKQAPAHASLAQHVLVWVLNASRPMRLAELEGAVATCPDTYKFSPDRIVPGETLLAICQGLIAFEEESQLVRLVHYTAMEPLQRLLYPLYPHPHSHLAAVCIAHLTLRGFKNTTISSREELTEALEGDPLLTYAFEAWDAHAKEVVGFVNISHQIIDFVLSCTAFPAIIDTLYGWAIFDILGPLHMLAMHNFPPTLFKSHCVGDVSHRTTVHQLSPLTIASLRGHFSLVQELIRLDPGSLNVTDKDGWSALIYAAAHGHEGIVALLLRQSGIMVNLVNNKGGSALRAAAANGWKGAVALLLDFPGIRVDIVDNNGMSGLMVASANGDDEVVELLLATPGIDINLAADDGRTALFWAAVNGRDGVVSLLLAHPGIDVHLAAKDGVSALMAAAANGHLGIAKLLLQDPATKVNAVSNAGASVFIYAAANGHENVVRFLRAIPGIDTSLATDDGYTALFLAAESGHEGVVSLLLAHPGIDVNLVAKDGTSVLMAACANGHEDIMILLLATPGIDINLAADDGRTALFWAAVNGRDGVVSLLLAHPGIDVNLVAEDGISALMAACANDHEDIVILLLATPGITINLAANDGRTALFLATENGHEGVVSLLLAHPGIDVNLVAKDGTSALMAACANGHEDIVILLLSTPDITVNWASNDGRTALFWAAANNCGSVVSLLLAHPGIDVNLVAKDGTSALMAAAASGYEGAAKLLQHPGIKVHIVNNIGMSVLMFAAANGHEGVVKLLLARPGVQVNQMRDDGMSALFGAANYGHEGAVALLVAHPGVNVNTVRNDGVSALMIAAHCGHKGVVRMLLNQPDIDISVRSTEGSHTALSVAMLLGHSGIVQMLQQFQSHKTAAGHFVDAGFDRRQLVASRVGIRGHVGSRVPPSPLTAPADSSPSILDLDV